VTKC